MEAEEEEAPPTLRLEILQGPRQGETLDFKPGAAVRIGRVVKGNTLPIKDPGISSKHLTISTESNKWTLRDLDSSNGTVLDGSQIPPHTPFTLSNHCTIKIGELTSIHVIFVPQQESAVQQRKYPTRRGRGRPKIQIQTSEENDATVEPARAEPVRTRGRGRPNVKIQSAEENDASVVDAESERVDPPARVPRKTNRGRGVVVVDNLDVPDGKVQVQSVEEKDAESERVGLPARVTRKRVRVCNDAAVAKEEPKSARNLSLIEISDSSVGNSGAPVVVEEPDNIRLARNSKKARGENAGNVEKKKTRRGVAGKRELEKEGEDLSGVKVACDGRKEGSLPDLKGRKRELQKEGDDRNGVKETCAGREEGNLPDLKGRKRELQKEGDDRNGVKETCGGREEGNLPDLKGRKKELQKEGDDRNGVKETCDGREGTNLPDLKRRKRGATEKRELEKEGEDGDGVKKPCDGNWPDLNKMTLGEWFDFLEVYLPKQIIDETEEMINSMTKKAERLREYILEVQQQNGKAKIQMEE